MKSGEEAQLPPLRALSAAEARWTYPPLLPERLPEVGTVLQVTLPTDPPRPARIYQPSKPARNRPGLLWLFGGGFVLGNLDSGESTCRYLCEQGGITPDILCLSKGITGGYLPLSAVLTTEDIYQAFYCEAPVSRAFLHSHSYTGNPLACRAALATLDLFGEQPVLEHNRTLAARLAARLAPLREHPHVADVRQTGLIAAVELVADKTSRTPFPAHERRGLRARLDALSRGVALRPLGDVIYAMPPYCTTPDEIDLIAGAIAHGIEAACR